jgi:hypothetical protein
MGDDTPQISYSSPSGLLSWTFVDSSHYFLSPKSELLQITIQRYAQQQNAVPHNDSSGSLGDCRALYDYVGADQHELDFFAGDILRILERDYESGWWTGELNGRIGLFPSNYIEEL